MKKSIISICITLILFFSSVVPVFANNGFEYVPFWLHDFYTQSVNYGNQGSNYFATWTASDANGYESNLLTYGLMQDKNTAATFYYTVSPGDTVYFRLAVQKNALGGSGYISTDLYIDGTLSSTTNYSVLNDGASGSQAFIFINQDYTNNSSTKKTIRYMIGNTNSANDIIYFPIACGTTDMINGDNVSLDVSGLPSIDTSDLESKLDELMDLMDEHSNILLDALNNIPYDLPFDFWQYASFFINCYDYEYQPSTDRVPWLHRTKTFATGYNSAQELRYVHTTGKLYFSVFSYYKENTKPVLYGQDGSIINAQTYNTTVRGNGFGCVITYLFNVPTDVNTRYSIWLPNDALFKQFIPLYIGDGRDVTDYISNLTGITTKTQSLIQNVFTKMDQFLSVFNDKTSPSISKGESANNDLSQSVTQFDNIEKNQVENMTQNLNNLPTLDFNAYSDFAPTVQFVSNTMQQLYDSNNFLKLIIDICLVIGIALLLIGRGLRK